VLDANRRRRGVLGSVGGYRRPPWRHAGRGLARGVVELGCLAQDPFVQLAQRRCGVDAELVGQDRAQPLVGGQRLALAAQPVVREHQPGPRRLA
jgi:hypothetical protein